MLVALRRTAEGAAFKLLHGAQPVGGWRGPIVDDRETGPHEGLGRHGTQSAGSRFGGCLPAHY